MQGRPFDVLVVGELNVDLILNKLEKPPEVGKEVLAHQMILTLGSSSAIFACNLSTLGSRVAFCGKIGKDSFAQTVLSSLEEKKVDTRFVVRVENESTGASVALSYGEDRAMITYPGAMDTFSISDINDEVFESANHLHLSSIFLQKALKPDIITLFRKARQSGMTTSLDTQWDPAEEWDLDLKELLPLVDVFLPNKSEILALTRQTNLENAKDTLKEHINTLVVKDGSNGAYLWSGDICLKQEVFLNKSLVDAIGAGDSFNAGYICKYIHGKSLKECLEYGALAGAVNTTCSGGTTAFKNFDTFKEIARINFQYIV